MDEVFWTLTFGLGLAALAATDVTAQGQNCAPREVVIEHLADGFGETRQSMGLGGQGQVVEMFASTDTGTWTITVTLPTGLTCMIASGQSYETLAEVLPNADDDV